MAIRLLPTARYCPKIYQNRVLQAAPARRQYATTSIPAGLKVNGRRLWDEIHHTCQWGTGARWGEALHETGMSRLSLSDADKEARDWFVETTRSLGCRVTVDAIGNTFAVRPGRRDGPATCAGSHLDTQPTGGRYDGILGVHAGVEMLRVLQENKIETAFPVGVINWTNEEGARFPQSMLASGVWAEAIGLDEAHSLKEVGDGARTVKQELARIGYLGETPASYKANPIAAHFELHIEQGPRLEDARQKIGVVTGVQSYKWFEAKVIGRDAHTGATPFHLRADSLLTAAAFVQIANQEAKQKGALASTGIFKAFPGSVNTVPGLVIFSLDVRATENNVRDDTLSSIGKSWDAWLTQHAPDVRYELKQTFQSDAVKFDEDCMNCVRESAKANFGDSYADLVSGAGHDSVFASKHVPTTMIFVPCKGGVSHHPEEYCSPEDCANGAQVLMDSILRYDQKRAVLA